MHQTGSPLPRPSVPKPSVPKPSVPKPSAPKPSATVSEEPLNEPIIPPTAEKQPPRDPNALSNVLAELEQWFGWGKTSAQDGEATQRSDTALTDTNELLIETIDQELDQWEIENEVTDSEQTGDGSSSEAGTDEGEESAAVETTQTEDRALPLTESVEAIEQANLTEVLAWATVNPATTLAPHRLEQSDPLGVVDPFAIAEEEEWAETSEAGSGSGAQNITTLDIATLDDVAVEDETEESPASEVAPEEPEPDSVTIPVIPSTDNDILTYEGPEEVLLRTPTVLRGTYDKTRAASVTVTAEDKYPFAVMLDGTARTWAVNLSEGFYQAGARWLRVQAVDQQNRVLESKVIHLVVSNNPLSVGQALQLTVQRDTLFKDSPVDSEMLEANRQIEISAGQSFTVQRYSYADGYLLVELEDSLPDVGTTGYFYASHVELRKGQQILAFDLGQVPVLEPENSQAWVLQDTLIKQRPVDSSNLATTQVHRLTQGEHFEVTGYACMRGHFRITLQNEIPGFGKTGYLYPGHIHLNHDNEEVAFSPDALLLSVVEQTVFKKRPVNSSNLAENEQSSLSQGQVYGVRHYHRTEENHLIVTLSDSIPGFGQTGYLYADHVQLHRGTQVIQVADAQLELDVSYSGSSQQDWLPNQAALTALAGVLDYYGIQPQHQIARAPNNSLAQESWEQELKYWCINNLGVDSPSENGDLVRLAQAHGLQASFGTDRTWEAVRDRLNQKQPVLISGQFTNQKHLLTVIGYNRKGYIVHDSRGDALTGYRSAYGRKRFYPKTYMEKMCSASDGRVWAHFMEPRASS